MGVVSAVDGTVTAMPTPITMTMCGVVLAGAAEVAVGDLTEVVLTIGEGLMVVTVPVEGSAAVVIVIVVDLTGVAMEAEETLTVAAVTAEIMIKEATVVETIVVEDLTGVGMVVMGDLIVGEALTEVATTAEEDMAARVVMRVDLVVVVALGTEGIQEITEVMAVMGIMAAKATREGTIWIHRGSLAEIVV